MRDYLPATLAQRRHVTGIVQEVYERHGFVPLETPAIENLSTLTGKYGEEGDQLLYRILHRRDALKRALEKDDVGEADLADIGLRYDLTVPLARVVAQYAELPKFFKRYQIQPVWRADRPGKGRFREFYQCDVDITGTESLVAEAEVCSAVSEVLERLGFTDFTIQLNHRQLLRALIQAAGIDTAQEEIALVAVDKLDKIGRDGVLKELAEREVAPAAAEKLLDLLALDEAATNADTLTRLRGELTSEQATNALGDIERLLAFSEATPAGSHLRVNPALARGLGYYTGCIFEISVPGLGGSMGGGGRYDGLVGMFGKQQIPAVGFSLGLERILLVMDERQMYPALSTGADVLLCWMGVEETQVLKTARALRDQGLKVEVFAEPRKLGKQLQYADSDGVKIPVAAIVGESEIAEGKVTLKHLAKGEQATVKVEDAAAQIEAWKG